MRNLIKKLEIIDFKYQKLKENDSFNLFEILRKRNDEVNLHSSSSLTQMYEKSVSATSFTKIENLDNNEVTESEVKIDPKKLVFNNESDLSIEDTIKKADVAVYQAKNAGRNCVITL